MIENLEAEARGALNSVMALQKIRLLYYVQLMSFLI